MTNLSMQIRLANLDDLDGILALQSTNQPENGGMLSAKFSPEHILKLMHAMPMIVAHREDRITGYLMNSTRAIGANVPILNAMLAAYPGTANAYIYGPICVSAEERGNGVAQRMFAELKKLLPNREGILFIRRDNTPSLRAHEKMGMRDVANFVFDGNELAVFAYVG